MCSGSCSSYSTSNLTPCLWLGKSSRRWLVCLGSCHLHGRPKLSSRLLALTWPVVTSWGEKLMWRISLFHPLCNSGFQNKSKQTVTQNWSLLLTAYLNTSFSHSNRPPLGLLNLTLCDSSPLAAFLWIRSVLVQHLSSLFLLMQPNKLF